jgi:hypothetical protein
MTDVNFQAAQAILEQAKRRFSVGGGERRVGYAPDNIETKSGHQTLLLSSWPAA